MMESSVEQPTWTPPPLEKETNFCEFMQCQFDEEPCHIAFHITPVFIKFCVHYNYPTLDVFDNLLRELNENMEEFDLKDLGWSDFYVRKNILNAPIDGFTKEWECISFNSNLTDLLKSID